MLFDDASLQTVNSMTSPILQAPQMKHQPLIKKLRAGLKADETGNKANSLIFLHHYGFTIPLTYLVTTRADDIYLAGGKVVP